MGPLISVIVPVYNVFPYFREAIESVINQKHENLEIIIIDDGSTDGSSELCDEYTFDSRVKVVHQENKGLSGARNTGLDLMTGDYVAFFDSDDIYYPEMICALLETIEKQNVDFATCGMEVCKSEGLLSKAQKLFEISPEKEAIISGQEALIALLSGKMNVSVCNKLYNKRIWEHLRFAEGQIYEDLLIMPKIIEKCEFIAVMPQVLMRYRWRKKSITNTKTIWNMQEYLSAQKMLEIYVRDVPEIFSEGCMRSLRENTLRGMIIYWAELRKKNIGEKEIAKIQDDIWKYAEENISCQQLRSRIVWWLFRNYPSMLLPLQAVYHKIIGLLNNNRGIIA